MKLDVGCGDHPEGDVNCDLYIKDIGHRGHKGTHINLNRTPNFLVCDAHNLPFKDEAFNEVTCNQVIEHVDNPCQLMSELVRVSSSKINVRCPHRYSRKNNDFHINFFSKAWFSKAMVKLGCYGFVRYSAPIYFFPFMPVYLTVQMWKH